MNYIFKKIIWILLLSALLLYADVWRNGTSLNKPRAGAAALTWNGKIYVFGGKSINNKVLNTVEVYDPASDTWDSTLVKPFDEERYNASVVVWDDKFYLIGGRNIEEVLESVEVYDPVQNEWEEAHHLRSEREGHTSAVFNNRIYTIGGQKNNFDLLDEIEWYDAEEDKWEDADFDIFYPRSALFSAVYNNEFYMFGGYYYGLTLLSCRLYPGNDGYEWEQLPSLSEARAYGVTARIDSLIYLIGGETKNGKTNLVEIYNINSGKLTRGTDMNMSHSGMACAAIDNRIYSIGGYEGIANDPVNHVHVLETSVTGLEKPDIRPQSMLLARAYPNPFNGRVRIEIDIPSGGAVAVDILNAMGQKISTIHDNILPSGKNTLLWNTHDSRGAINASGIYFARIRFKNQQHLLKLIYVK